MDKQTLINMTDELYNISKNAGIVDDLSYDEVFPEVYINNVVTESATISGLETLLLREKIIDIAEKNGRAFYLDWRWDPKDLAWNINNAIPNLGLEILEEVQNDDSMFLRVSILGSEIEVTTNSPYDLVTLINGKLENVEILAVDSEGDSYIFLIVDSKYATEIANSEFFGTTRL